MPHNNYINTAVQFYTAYGRMSAIYIGWCIYTVAVVNKFSRRPKFEEKFELMKSATQMNIFMMGL